MILIVYKVVVLKYLVIIPVYNAERTLSRCVNSILNQDFNDYEIILVNDGSKDKSLEICNDFSDKYENIFTINKENGGASSARNAGLDHARGDFILFVDSDDYVEDHYFFEFEKYGYNDGWVIFKDSWEVGDRIIRKTINAGINDAERIEKYKYLIASRMINSPCAKRFDRKIIENNRLRFNTDMIVAEDFDFGLRYLFLCKNITVADVSVYIYNATSSGSLVRRKKENLIDVYPLVFDAAFKTIFESDFNEDEKTQLCRICDMLHVESFGTCVMEEFKDDGKLPKEIKKEIKNMCIKFYSRYKGGYGYQNIIHFVMRLCIKHKWSNALYILGKSYVEMRSRRIK